MCTKYALFSLYLAPCRWRTNDLVRLIRSDLLLRGGQSDEFPVQWCANVRQFAMCQPLRLFSCFLNAFGSNKPNKNSSSRWMIASLKRHYLAVSVVRVQSRKSEDLNAVEPSDPISVNMCITPITGSYLQLPNALSVAAHLGGTSGKTNKPKQAAKKQAPKIAASKKPMDKKKKTNDKWAWKNKPAKESDSKEYEAFVKSFETKKYFWCKNHNNRTGMWTLHHPNDCESGSGFNKTMTNSNHTAFHTVDSDSE